MLKLLDVNHPSFIRGYDFLPVKGEIYLRLPYLPTIIFFLTEF